MIEVGIIGTVNNSMNKQNKMYTKKACKNQMDGV